MHFFELPRSGAPKMQEQRKTGHSLVGCNPLISLVINGRRGGIRTRDPLHPMQVRYQAALHADKL